MLPIPSWKWLSFRPTREIVAGAATPSRPCLPAVDQLDDRVMLSASTVSAGDSVGTPPPIGDYQILIGLLKGQVDLVSQELGALKLAGDLKLDVHKFTQSFLKIDGVLYKFGEDLLKGDLTDHKSDKTIADLKIEFLKIDALIGGLPRETGGELKFVLDSIEHKAGELVHLLGRSTGGGELSHKIELNYLKVADSFLKLDGAILKFQEDAIARKAGGKGNTEYLKIKLEEVLISSHKIGDEGLQRELLGLEELTAGLLHSGDGFTGGVATVGDTGDVLA